MHWVRPTPPVTAGYFFTVVLVFQLRPGGRQNVSREEAGEGLWLLVEGPRPSSGEKQMDAGGSSPDSASAPPQTLRSSWDEGG